MSNHSDARQRAAPFLSLMLTALLLAACSLPVRIDTPRGANVPTRQSAVDAAPTSRRLRAPPSASVAAAPSDGRLLAQANAQLQKLYSLTGLSDAQLARIQQAEAAIARNDGASAVAITSALLEQLRSSEKHHKVSRGESLWTISARPDIYANPFLWPLIWQANPDTVKNPSSVREGQVLKIRPNPTVNEVVEAVNFAHGHSSGRINIGEVREVAPDSP